MIHPTTSRKKQRLLNLSWTFSHILAATLAFHGGLIYTLSSKTTTTTTTPTTSTTILLSSAEWSIQNNPCDISKSTTLTRKKLFGFLNYWTTVSRDEFVKAFPLGSPTRDSEPDNDRVLMMYTSFAAARRIKQEHYKTTVQSTKGEALTQSPLPQLSLDHLVSSACDIVHVVRTSKFAKGYGRNDHTCLAIISTNTAAAASARRRAVTTAARTASSSSVSTIRQNSLGTPHHVVIMPDILKWSRAVSPIKIGIVRDYDLLNATDLTAQQRSKSSLDSSSGGGGGGGGPKVVDAKTLLFRVNRYFFPESNGLSSGVELGIPLVENERTDSFQELSSYLKHSSVALQQLQSLVEQVAYSPTSTEFTKGALIVLVTNFGHADLFLNFVCASRNVGLDTSKLLLFATDKDTYELAHAMGIAAFHSEELFGGIPYNAARSYGGPMYTKIMSSKLYASHLLSQLKPPIMGKDRGDGARRGYDFLFQDVDIVPYSSQYLEYFVNRSKHEDYDLFFQNDLNARSVYAPWVANSGCYFVKYNERTRYFFSNFLVMGGDRILQASSHQAVQHTVLSQQASVYGLRIKTLSDKHEANIVPIGHHFHRNKAFMKELIKSNKTISLSFHMNWNSNRKDKLTFLQQMGDWYVIQKCNQHPLAHIKKYTAGGEARFSKPGWLSGACCSPEPLVQCHWKDKPSVIPCKDKPSFDNNRPSFW